MGRPLAWQEAGSDAFSNKEKIMKSNQWWIPWAIGGIGMFSRISESTSIFYDPLWWVFCIIACLAIPVAAYGRID